MASLTMFFLVANIAHLGFGSRRSVGSQHSHSPPSTKRPRRRRVESPLNLFLRGGLSEPEQDSLCRRTGLPRQDHEMNSRNEFRGTKFTALISLLHHPSLAMKGRLTAFVAVSIIVVTYLFSHVALDLRPHKLASSSISRLGKSLLDLAAPPNASCPTVPPQCPPNQICLPKARYLSPTELMKRPLSPVNGSIPKIIHQSWKSEELPERFAHWSDTWRMHHPDWEWVLWTNEDNKALVDLHFGWFKEKYDDLEYEILRVDTARNMYMYIFGG